MSIISNTYTGYDAEGEREDLQDMIFDISPTDTPFISGMGRGKASAVTHEWQTDSLADAVTNNQQYEGDDVVGSSDALSATGKPANICEIARKLITISGTLEVVDKAGRKSELAYQLAKAGKEIKRDMEKALLDSHVAVTPGATNSIRKAAPLPNWIQTNSSTAAGGADSTSNSGSGVPVSARTDAGTPRALTETIAKAVIEKLM
jgi:hypothetical protein